MARQYLFCPDDDGEKVEIAVRGRQILARPMINFGTAYSLDERRQLGLSGLLPPAVSTLNAQAKRVYEQYRNQPDDLSKNVYLTALQDRNEILFYRVVSDHLEEMMPIIYTPTIGEAIQKFSQWFNRPRGMFLSIEDADNIEDALRSYGQGPDDVDLIVVTDSEGILGIGDQGVGGIRICVGKLTVYTAAAGIHPLRVLPIVLDVGTDNMELLNDEGYLGVHQARVRGKRYDDFVDSFVKAATKMFPKALVHWEDFGAANAHRILEKYRDEICTFNDDIQGTAAVVVGAALAAVKAKGETMSEQRVVIHGAGTAGVGIADLLTQVLVDEGMPVEEARKKFWCLGSRGLIRSDSKMRPFQEPYARTTAEVTDWELDAKGRYELLDVVRNVQPTILVGTSGQPDTFTEKVVREMHAHCARPVIMPLSNPTKLTEALPSDVLEWTDGDAMMATGSPFEPIHHEGVEFEIAQANNALVFPGIGLGVIAVRATRVTDRMIAAAARAVAEMTDATKRGSALLPSMAHLRAVSATVALRVAEAAAEEGVATVELENPIQDIYDKMWKPNYPRVKVVTNELTPKRKG
ncbi:oxaloacetate-decarboxylating malate dehydrogenase [Mariniluteicoccus endophyticus]